MVKSKKEELAETIKDIRQQGVRIVCFGGSNTLANSLRKQYGTVMKDIIAMKSSVPIFLAISGESGAVATNSHDRFVNDVLSAEPSIVVFEFGQHERDLGIPAAEMQKALKQMIVQLKKAKGTAMLLAPTLVQDEVKAKKSAPYAAALRKLSSETKSRFIDPAKELKKTSNSYIRSYFMDSSDWVHWSEKGQEEVGKILAEVALKAKLVPVQKGLKI